MKLSQPASYRGSRRPGSIHNTPNERRGRRVKGHGPQHAPAQVRGGVLDPVQEAGVGPRDELARLDGDAVLGARGRIGQHEVPVALKVHDGHVPVGQRLKKLQRRNQTKRGLVSYRWLLLLLSLYN